MDNLDVTKSGFILKWTIKNFDFFPKDDRQLQSPSFIMDSFPKVRWSLELKLVETFLNFSLQRTLSGTNVINLCFTLLLVSDSNKIDKVEGILGFKNEQSCNSMHCFNEYESLLLLNNKTLVIYCHFWGNFSPQVSTAVLCCAQTHFEVDNVSTDWMIPGFSNLYPDMKMFYNVPVAWRDFIPLKLAFYFSGTVCTFQNLCIDIICNATVCLESLEMHCKITLLNTRKEIIATLSNMCLFPTIDESVWHFPKFSSENTAIKGFLPDNILIISFEFRISYGEPFTWILESKYLPSEVNTKTNFSSTKVHDEFNWMIITNNRSFPTHKEVLSAASPFFNALGIATNDIAEISESDEDTFKQMLKFIYSESLQHRDWPTVCKLYVASKKYEVLTLNNRCSQYLRCNLSTENVCEVLSLAYYHKDAILQSAVEDFIWNNAKIVFQSDAWKSLMDDNSSSACEAVVQAFYKNMCI